MLEVSILNQLDKKPNRWTKIFFSKKGSAYLNVFHRKKFFKHDEQKGLIKNY